MNLVQSAFCNCLFLSINCTTLLSFSLQQDISYQFTKAGSPPDIKGIDLDHVHYVKTFHEASKIEAIKSVAVIGVGYIDVELVEAIQLRGKKTYILRRILLFY